MSNLFETLKSCSDKQLRIYVFIATLILTVISSIVNSEIAGTLIFLCAYSTMVAPDLRPYYLSLPPMMAKAFVFAGLLTFLAGPLGLFLAPLSTPNGTVLAFAMGALQPVMLSFSMSFQKSPQARAAREVFKKTKKKQNKKDRKRYH